ncbi:NUDIX domain-containing protein [Sphingopyxis witflariensis]|uniref:NUDIX hydrolase n=1 Tax=Sphingopyxis witflariensis TaxID=173675 RepID=A0A246JDJ1_9SPHN|nr:NUDIX domain-containing protein [Sphingopyxis witflariensis]OWQ90648.1 NUDIX hydrolase [Sphingopyxis witflariensis]
MTGQSAGILLYRRSGGALQVLLVHPGGPFWRRRDRGAWQIPKGLIAPGESAEDAARREAQEELGVALEGPLAALGQLRQAGGKMVEAFALEQDIDAAAIVSNRFELEWPPESGRSQFFPEVDAARWFTLAEADTTMLSSQRPFLDRLSERLARRD